MTALVVQREPHEIIDIILHAIALRITANAAHIMNLHTVGDALAHLDIVDIIIIDLAALAVLLLERRAAAA